MDWVKRLNKPLVLVGVVSACAIAAMSVAVYFYVQYQAAQDRIQNPTAAAQQEAHQLVAAVGKLMMLPTDEDPTIASVTDRDQLQNQPFFANAVNGDKVLIYLKSKKAVLYRPDINKIIEVAPVNISASDSATAVAPTVTVALRNGTSAVGLTKKYETGLTAKVPGVSIVDRDTAAKTDYAKTYIFDLTGTKGDQAAQLGSTLGITVGQLPKEENVQNLAGKADFLIIVGADKK